MSGMKDPFHLQRFVDAQSGVIDRVYAELRAGQKGSHWMWFIFPQIAGLGQSPTSRHFAIRSIDEAQAYLAHPVLGMRLTECAEVVAATSDRTAPEIFGSIDAQKLRSSITLFRQAAPDVTVFTTVLERFFDGEPDPETLKRV